MMTFSGKCYSINAVLALLHVLLLEITMQPDSQTGCGRIRLTIVKNNLKEGEMAQLWSSIQPEPGRDIVWEKKVGSVFKQLNKSKNIKIVSYKTELFIYNSKYSDSGVYRVNCQTSVSNTVELKIIPTAPSAPEFEDIEDIYNCKNCLPAQLNVEMNVMCFVEGGSEPIELEMLKTGEHHANAQREYKKSLKRTTLKYTFTPSAKDFDSVFTCTVKNPAMEKESVNSSRLYIRVDPETVDIKVPPAKENETTEVQCTTTKGRPPIKSHIFFKTEKTEQDNLKITNEIVTGHMYSVTTTLSRSFTRFDNQGDILCCSNILTTKCSNATRVNVKFPPRNVKVTEVEKTNEENGDTVLTLECSVDESNLKSMVNWKGVKNLPQKVLVEKYEIHSETSGWIFTTVLMFNLTKDDNNRNIRCQVTNQEFPDLLIQHSYRPNITYAPVITISKKGNKTVYPGDDVFLTCHVDSNPTSVIVWYNETDKLEEAYGANTLDLHLVNITLEHSQTYTCTATNNIGDTRRRDITLIVKDASDKPYKESYALYVTGMVICTAVVIIVAVVAIVIFLTVRKRKQNTALKRKESNEIKTEERKQRKTSKTEETNTNTAPGLNSNDAPEDAQYDYRDSEHATAGEKAIVVKGVSVSYRKMDAKDSYDPNAEDVSEAYSTLMQYQNPTENLYSGLNNPHE